jgi:uncharacterized membrane protein YphA (DoxX/SURF4 family)
VNHGSGTDSVLADALVPGRILFAAIFILSGIGHLTRAGAMSQYAAAFKVPQPRLAVIVTGLMILTGGLSILLGYQVRAGALLLVVFLVPAAVYMHPFWGGQEAMQAANQQAHFLKNLSLAGAALMIYYFATVAPKQWVYGLGR